MLDRFAGLKETSQLYYSTPFGGVQEKEAAQKINELVRELLTEKLTTDELFIIYDCLPPYKDIASEVVQLYNRQFDRLKEERKAREKK